VKIRGNNHLSWQKWSSVLNRGLVYLANLKASGALGTAPLVVNISLERPDPDAVERAAIDCVIA
jgi:hypothetical protein